ncbi:MAG: hypothetical protein HXS41_02015 [Theionarchaea archaeon]|nr:hypothetical protein [Theionarchaea archaeon]MBU7001315.1 hypothetical protein [Theionarchaea archaeon]MBU7019806.1 hypothetical protein [Theionarchaea archaeon]MBU7040770.1 hypothetical protein [Theionarchaea archaeon]
MWIAVRVGEDTILFNSDSEETLNWLKEIHGVGQTREEAIFDLERRLSHEK